MRTPMIWHLIFVSILCASTTIVFGMEEELARKKASLKINCLLEKYGFKSVDEDKNEYVSSKPFLRKMIEDDSIIVDLPLLEEFKKRGGDINAMMSKDGFQYPIIWSLIGDPNRMKIKMIGQCGADMALRNSVGETILHWLCEIDEYETHAIEGVDLIKYFVSLGADINAEAKNGCMPLTIAFHNKHRTLANQLLKHGAEPFGDNHKSNLLYFAINEKEIDDQLWAARLWFDLPRMPYLMAILFTFKILNFSHKDMKLKVLSYLPQYIPDHCLSTIYQKEVAKKMLELRDREKLILLEEIKSCLPEKKKKTK